MSPGLRVAWIATGLFACGRVGFAHEDASPPADDVAPIACDPTFALVGPSGERYLLVAAPHRLWSEATAACAAFGAGHRLAVFTSEADLRTVGDAAATLTTGSWIVGLTDAAVEGTWRDVDGAVATFLPWGINEPNDSGGEDCASLLADPALGADYHNRYNDVLCQLAWPSICQCSTAGP